MNGNEALIVLVTDVADSINFHLSKEEKKVENNRYIEINAEQEEHLFLLNRQIVSLQEDFTVSQSRMLKKEHKTNFKVFDEIRMKLTELNLSQCYFSDITKMNMNCVFKSQMEELNPMSLINFGLALCEIQGLMRQITPEIKLNEVQNRAVLCEKSRISQTLFRMIQQASRRTKVGKILLQVFLVKLSHLKRLRSSQFYREMFTTKIVDTDSEDEAFHLVYIVTDRAAYQTGKEIRQSNDDFLFFQPILAAIKAKLWSYQSQRGTSALLATPIDQCTRRLFRDLNFRSEVQLEDAQRQISAFMAESMENEQ